MAYRRNTYFRDYYSSKCKISCHWSNTAGAYMIKTSNMGNNFPYWQLCLNYIKQAPITERDIQKEEKTNPRTGKTYNEWTFYLHEKWIDGLKAIVDTMPEYLEWDFVKKPDVTSQSFQTTFVPTDTYFDRLKNIMGEDIRTLEYKDARRRYLKWIMQHHPDKGGDPRLASDVNECWSALEVNHYKIKKEMELV